MEQCQKERGRGGLDAISAAGQTYSNTDTSQLRAEYSSIFVLIYSGV